MEPFAAFDFLTDWWKVIGWRNRFLPLRPRLKPATTRTFRSREWWSWSARYSEELRGQEPGTLSSGGGIRTAKRHPDCRHKIRMGPFERSINPHR